MRHKRKSGPLGPPIKQPSVLGLWTLVLSEYSARTGLCKIAARLSAACGDKEKVWLAVPGRALFAHTVSAANHPAAAAWRVARNRDARRAAPPSTPRNRDR